MSLIDCVQMKTEQKELQTEKADQTMPLGAV